MEKKQNVRPRRYRLEPLVDFRNKELAALAAGLVEQSDRVLDQLSDLPAEGMLFAAGDPALTIGWLAVHMIWGEAVWTERATARPIPADLAASVKDASFASYGASAGVYNDPAEVGRLYARLRAEYIHPALREVEDLDREFDSKGLKVNVRGIMTHLLWHWTYHSGQIGLLRLLWGSEYVWSFDGNLTVFK